jgi:hypothetical protein
MFAGMSWMNFPGLYEYVGRFDTTKVLLLAVILRLEAKVVGDAGRPHHTVIALIDKSGRQKTFC